MDQIYVFFLIPPLSTFQYFNIVKSSDFFQLKLLKRRDQDHSEY